MTTNQVASLSFVLAVAGQYNKIEGELEKTLRSLESAIVNLNAKLVVGFETPYWLNTPIAQTLTNRSFKKNLKTFIASQENSLAYIFNESLDLVETSHILFLWPGCSPVVDEIQALLQAPDTNNYDWLAKIDNRYTSNLGIAPTYLRDTFLNYFLMSETLFPLCQALIRKDTLKVGGAFSPHPILQKQFDLEFWLRSSYEDNKTYFIDKDICSYKWTLETFPFSKDLMVPHYLSHSFRLRYARSKGDASVGDRFIQDLSDKEMEFVLNLNNQKLNINKKSKKETGKFKIAVTGGIWEYVHNKLCFYNYFNFLEGSEEFIYFPVLDFLVNPENDLCNMDCVIISRGKHENVIRILEYCQLHKIPTIYMIDDNWFSVGKDYPEPYASIFSPGMPAFDTFLRCVKECDAVLVYNTLLENDIRKYARHVIRLNVNICLDDFTKGTIPLTFEKQVQELLEWRENSNGLIIGYAGSTRYNDAAFKALTNIGRLYSKQVRLLLFGTFTPGQIEMLGTLGIFLPYVSYETYAKIMAHIHPDILIAPLEMSHTSQSKCPNKYLEYSAVKSAGIYSNLHPYNDVVKNGITGLFVENNQEEDWENTIIKLIEDPTMRQAISSAAYKDVIEKYETSNVVSSFVAAVKSVIKGQ